MADSNNALQSSAEFCDFIREKIYECFCLVVEIHLRMPGNYQRISSRKSWSQEDMKMAIEAVKENRMGWLLASKHFIVPQATLRRYFYSTVNLGRFKPTFNADMEKLLVNHIVEFESRLFGFNTTEIRKLAFEFAEKLKLEHRFDKSKKIAGWDWLKGFRERNPHISLRAPEPTSAARARAFNKPQVMKFFSLLEKVVSDNGIQAHRIYNMDESGLTTVQKPAKIFASKGKKQVGAVTSEERGEHFTVVCCVNAIGNSVPPAIIMPRKNYKAEYFDGAPPGTLGLCYPSGYMVGDLFLKWMRHFVTFVNASVTNKVLLILDGHSSHKNLEALEFAKANGVIMICLPPHCTHRMQPTDVSFFGPLKAYYDRELTAWMKNHSGRTVGLFQVAGIFGRAYENAATVKNITSGFMKTGIYPYNPHIFPEDLFLPSEVTENELNDDELDDDELIASTSSQPQQNHEKSECLESNDAEEELINIAANNSHEQIDSVPDATRVIETRPSSPTILSSNIATHLLLRTVSEKIEVFTAPDKHVMPQKAVYSPLSLIQLAQNFVINLLKDHGVNTNSSCLQRMPKSASKNTQEQSNVFIAPKNDYRAKTNDINADFKKNSRHSLLQPEIYTAETDILNEISPLPKATSTRKLRVKRKVGGSQVFTSSPFMKEIKAQVQQKKEKENRIALKKQKQTKRVILEDNDVEFKPAVKKLKVKGDRKKSQPNILDDEKNVEKDNKVEPEPAPKKPRPNRARKQKQQISFDDDDELPFTNEDDEENDAVCIYCNELFSQSRPKEHWVKCQLCSKWCHTLCAGIPAKTKQFICELCS